MSRKLRSVGLALLAVVAIGAVAAPAASAKIDKFTANVEPWIMKGAQVAAGIHTFGTKGTSLAVSCDNVTLKGTVKTKSTTSLTMTPTFPGKCNGGTAGDVTMDSTGCNYIVTGETLAYKNTKDENDGEDATFDIECSGTNVIKATAAGCAISIPAQNNLLGLRIDPGKGGATLTVTLDKISYTTAGSLCAALGLKSSNNDGFLTEEIKLTGVKDLEGEVEGEEIEFTVE